MSEYALNRTQNNCRSQVAFAKHLKWPQEERPAKIIIAANFFPKILQYVWQGPKYRRTLNIPGF